ncbi:hypothetical protein [Brevundimonas sp.]|uniref:hypothetical protein n=1 Tax=Brevundimonas sp. TaxID=1871086 RepID=UPI0025CE81E0|nr:hypothetical protein [Brevundimonas sp.]
MRALLLRLLTNRRSAIVLWTAVGLLVAGVHFWPVAFPTANAARHSVTLGAAERAELRAPTRSELEMLRSLPLLRDPLAPAFPPAQAAPPIASGQVFGMRDELRAPFIRATQALRTAAPACAAWIQGDADSVPAEIADAQAAMGELANGSSQDRGLFLYHQGLVDLCGPNPGSAAQAFERALAEYAAYAESAPEREPLVERRLAQYQAVTHYGLGLALVASDDDLRRADAEFASALEAATRAKSHRQLGPFVNLAACQDGPNCDLFDFSTAHIHNARLFARMREGQGSDAYEDADPALASSPGYVLAYPELAANLAAAAAAQGDFETVARLYQTLKARQGDEEADPEDPPSETWARIAGLAVVSPRPIYAEGDPWPLGASSPTREMFESRIRARDEASWFPAVSLGAEDREILDLWLWVRRERQLLETGQFRAFRSDGSTIANLGPETRDFLETWRSEVSGRLADALLERAETTRRRNGLAEARPLLALVDSDGFPWFWERPLARIGYYNDRPPLWVAGWGLFWLAVTGLAFWLHLQVAAGYRRTFGARHHSDRMAHGTESASGRP